MKTLKKFDFKETAAQSTYDWDTLLNGKIYVMEEGTDYVLKSHTAFYGMARIQAGKRGKKVALNHFAAGSTLNGEKLEAAVIVLQASDATDEELAEFNRKQEELKAKIKANKLKKANGNGDDDSDENE